TAIPAGRHRNDKPARLTRRDRPGTWNMNITEAEFDALEYVAIEGRVAAYDGPHILSLLERLRPFAKRENDSPQAVALKPQPHATLGEGTVQDRCTLTAFECGAIQRAIDALAVKAGDAADPIRGWNALACDDDADALRRVLMRFNTPDGNWAARRQ
ncbi:MAG: hypothetical protein EBR82_83365, partial [Caulobacteraceae bacterium]|nr:hypothetical protein [Caulobacteraceae bacterium]